MGKLDDAREFNKNVLQELKFYKYQTLLEAFKKQKELYEAAIEEEKKETRYKIAMSIIESSKQLFKEIAKNIEKSKIEFKVSNEVNRYFKKGIPESE